MLHSTCNKPCSLMQPFKAVSNSTTYPSMRQPAVQVPSQMEAQLHPKANITTITLFTCKGRKAQNRENNKQPVYN